MKLQNATGENGKQRKSWFCQSENEEIEQLRNFGQSNWMHKLLSEGNGLNGTHDRVSNSIYDDSLVIALLIIFTWRDLTLSVCVRCTVTVLCCCCTHLSVFFPCIAVLKNCSCFQVHIQKQVQLWFCVLDSILLWLTECLTRSELGIYIHIGYPQQDR